MTQTKKYKILFYRNDWNSNASRQADDGYGGVGYYRIVQPAKYVKEHEVTVVGAKLTKKGETPEKLWTRIFKNYDVFWTTYFSDPQWASAMFYHRDKLKKKVVIDLDDNYLDVPTSHPLYDRFKETKRDKAFLSTILTFADAITVSTEPLKQRIAEHLKKIYKMEKPIFVIPNMNQISDWKFKPAEKHKNKVVIGYSGSNSHDEDLKMMFPTLARIMDKYPNVYFETLGAVGKKNIELFTPFSESAKLRCDILPSTWTFNEYPKYLSTLKWDIGLAPLIDSSFTRCKSSIKFFEYSMYKIPTIVSRVYPYYVPCFGREVIQNEVTGLLVKQNEWEQALEKLILDKDLRIKLGENAYNFIKQEWQYDGNSDFSDAIDKVIKSL